MIYKSKQYKTGEVVGMLSCTQSIEIAMHLPSMPYGFYTFFLTTMLKHMKINTGTFEENIAEHEDSD